jgi:hypothetical protein
MAKTRVVQKENGALERSYTWTGGAFPRPDTSALTAVEGVTVRYEGGNKLVVTVDNVRKWGRVNRNAARAVAIAAGGTDIERVEK